jgi:hypothetical protein
MTRPDDRTQSGKRDARPATKKILVGVGIVVLFFLAGYGAVRFVMDGIAADDGKRVSQIAGTVASKAVKAAGEKLVDDLNNTPDKVLEADAEKRARKIYPIMKGAMKGNLKAFTEDKNKEELSRAMYEAGKEFSRTMLQPFAKGITDEPGPILGNVRGAVRRFEEIRRGSGGLLEGIIKGLESLGKDFGAERVTPTPRERGPDPSPYAPPPEYTPLPSPRQY